MIRIKHDWSRGVADRFMQDTLSQGASVTYRFQIVTIGVFSYPLTLFIAAM